MDNKDVLYAKWLSGEIGDDAIIDAEGPEALAALKKIKNNTDQWSMPKYNTAAGYQKFKQNNQTKAPKIRKINWFAIGGIAASILILGLCWNIFLNNSYEALFAANGETLHHVFNDGSEVWLNDGSSIEYDKKKWSDERTIQLTGEALFSVSKGEPFVVNSPNGSITVLGTQFNVRSWGENLYVECYEGKVRVNAKAQETILTANQAVNVVQDSMYSKQVISNTNPDWQKASSRFYEEKLSIVFDEIGRQYDINVTLKAKDRPFSGTFNHDDLENALRSICKPMGLKYNISSDQKSVFIE